MEEHMEGEGELILFWGRKVGKGSGGWFLFFSFRG